MDQAQASALHSTASDLDRDVAAFLRHTRATNESSRTQRAHDVALDDRLVRATGKGNRLRLVLIGSKTVKAIDHCIRLRDASP